MKRIAIVGGGVAGVAAAYFLAKSEAEIEVVLFEASGRLGGIVETVREGGFVVECGPDSWVTEKPWALEVATELGLGAEVIWSKDEGRKTYVRLDGRLEVMPDGMRMMVPGDMPRWSGRSFSVRRRRRLFGRRSEGRRRLKLWLRSGMKVLGHLWRGILGGRCLRGSPAPLLSGVFGGDVRKLSVRSVMPMFVAMERQFWVIDSWGAGQGPWGAEACVYFAQEWRGVAGGWDGGGDSAGLGKVGGRSSGIDESAGGVAG